MTMTLLIGVLRSSNIRAVKSHWFVIGPAACTVRLHWVGIYSSSSRGHLRPLSKPQGTAHYGHNSSLVRPVLSGSTNLHFPQWGVDTLYHTLMKKADKLKIAPANASQTSRGVYFGAKRCYINMCIWTQAHGWGDKSQSLFPVFNKLMVGFMSLLLSLLQLAWKKVTTTVFVFTTCLSMLKLNFFFYITPNMFDPCKLHTCCTITKSS